MKMDSIKICMAVGLAAIGAVLAAAHPATAAVCNNLPPDPNWETTASCAPPNQNRASSVGLGILGTSSRALSLTVGLTSGTTSATARGFDFFGRPISGCQVFATPGQTDVRSASGRCNGGRTQQIGVNFN
jgi:hypothetical protein